MGKDKLIFLNTSDVLLGKILHHRYSLVRGWPGQAKKSIRRDDILFSEIRPANGRWAYVDVDADDYVVSTKLMVIRPRHGQVVPRFLYHFLTSPETTRWLQHLAESRSGTFPQITFDQVAELELPLPSLDDQQHIAAFLDAIDRRIELSRQMSETLESIACNLFDLKFGDSASWPIGTFSDVAEQRRNQENPLESPDAIYAHFSIPAYDEGQSPSLERGETIKSLKSRVTAGAVLLSKLNPEIERVWLVDVRAEDRAVCSTEFLVLYPRAPFDRGYVYCLARSPAFRRQIEALVTGTSKSHQRAHADAILDLPVALPTKDAATKFQKVASPLLDRVLACRRESRTLTALRNSLLPKLLSGELRVSTGGRIAEEAA